MRQISGDCSNGPRSVEVGALHVNDVGIEAPDDFAMRVLGKGQKERLVPMIDEAMAAVRRCWRYNPVDLDAARRSRLRTSTARS